MRIEGRRVMPLYKHLIHTELPTICFVGLPFKVLPFPLFHFQVNGFVKLIADRSYTFLGRQQLQTRRRFEYVRLCPARLTGTEFLIT